MVFQGKLALGDWVIGRLVHLFLLLPIRKKVLHSSKKEEAAEADASILEILEFGGGERDCCCCCRSVSCEVCGIIRWAVGMERFCKGLNKALKKS
jgi:hypothetical protein